jgi:peptidoglycan/xylan/chitin deacetylase (PgdA/CDA1 family)
MDYRKVIFKSLRYTGIPYLIREIIQRRKVTILLFHDIDPVKADIYFKVLNEKYNIISLKEYIDAREKGTFNLPPKSLIITFDDGKKNNYLLKPLFKKYSINATIFLCAGIIGTYKHFWFSHNLKRNARDNLKLLPDEERLIFFERCGYTEEKKFDSRQALSEAEIGELKEIVDFQSHTIYHPVLPKCTDEKAHKEITTSKKILEEQYNLEIDSLSYPNGDYGKREILLAKKAGYKYGITVDAGYNTIKTDPFKLRRITVRDNCDVDELLVKASGLWIYLIKFIERIKFSK